MNEIHLPVQYESLGIEGLKSHFRYITTLTKNGYCAEVYLHELNVVIPITKTIYKTKVDIIEFLLRSGSIARDNLADLKCTFLKQNYEIKVARTAKKSLIKNLQQPLAHPAGRNRNFFIGICSAKFVIFSRYPAARCPAGEAERYPLNFLGHYQIIVDTRYVIGYK